MKAWNKLPDNLRLPEVKPYYDILKKRWFSRFLKRLFDIFAGILVMILLSIPMIIIALAIKVSSPGPVLYRQERVTRYGKTFKIHKFRTMVVNADKIGSEVTTNHDSRITRTGFFLRKLRLDELPQIFDVISGNMSFVGVRPETLRYVNKYSPRMKATLLMPAGITSQASIEFKDEGKMLSGCIDVDKKYIEKVLPLKMEINYQSLLKFRWWRDVFVMIKTIFAVLK